MPHALLNFRVVSTAAIVMASVFLLGTGISLAEPVDGPGTVEPTSQPDRDTPTELPDTSGTADDASTGEAAPEGDAQEGVPTTQDAVPVTTVAVEATAESTAPTASDDTGTPAFPERTGSHATSPMSGDSGRPDEASTPPSPKTERTWELSSTGTGDFSTASPMADLASEGPAAAVVATEPSQPLPVFSPQTDHTVTYTNQSGNDVLVIYEADGRPLQQVVLRNGESTALPACDTAATRCSYLAVLADEHGEPVSPSPIVVRQVRNDRDVVTPGPNSSTAERVGMGYYGDGFTPTDDGVTYTNTSDQDVTVVYRNGAVTNVVEVRPGSSTTLPTCDTSGGTACDLIAGTGSWNPDDLSGFDELSVTRVDSYGVQYHEKTGYGPDFAPTSGGVTYRNPSDRVVRVTFDDLQGTEVMATVLPGQTVLLPACEGVGNTCRYSSSGVAVTVTTAAPITPPGNGTGTGTNQPPIEIDNPNPPRVRIPTVMPDIGRPFVSSRTPVSASSPNGNDGVDRRNGSPNPYYSAPWIPQVNLCSQLGGAGKLSGSKALSLAGNACAGYELGDAFGRGDWNAVANSGLGFFASGLKTLGPVGYLGGLAIDVWTYAAAEAGKIDGSTSVGEALSYSAAHPQQAIEALGQAVVTVAANLWPSFLR